MKSKEIISHATTQRTGFCEGTLWNRITVFVASLRSSRESGLRGLFIPLILHAMLLSSASWADTPSLTDFARQLPLTLSGSGALYELPLPAEVYLGVQRTDLGDLAVFNGVGEIVPFTLVQPLPAKYSVEQRQLPLFPLGGAARSRTGDLALQVRTDAGGTSVDLRTRPASAPPGEVTGYVVDAAALERPVSGFDLTLAPGAREYLGAVRVAISDDLRSWRDHGDGALAVLSAGAAQLSRSRIDFPPVPARYFRLVVSPEQGAPRLTGVSARLESSSPAPNRATQRYFLAPVPGEPGTYRVRTSGPLPVDRLRLVFDTDNALASAAFFSRQDDKSPWCERGSATCYRLRRGSGVVESAPLEVGPTTDREWLIRLRPAGPGERLPMLEIGWQPARLIFAASGEPPYSLAFGSARSGAASLRDDGIAAALAGWEKQGIKPVPAGAGASVESGGKKALRRQIPAATWKSIALWSVLVFGVAMLARMAWKLGREISLVDMQKNTAKNDSPVIEKGQERHSGH